MLADVLNLLKYAGFDLIVVETAGIGQSDTEIVDLVDVPMYVMTSEYGAASQLEKIDMLDFADLVALNKFEKRGAEDALRDVRKQWRRNRAEFTAPDEQVPVFPTIASRFNDPGVNRLFAALCARLDAKTGRHGALARAGSGPDGTRDAPRAGAGAALALPRRDCAERAPGARRRSRTGPRRPAVRRACYEALADARRCVAARAARAIPGGGAWR